jgi:hypothetical protein
MKDALPRSPVPFFQVPRGAEFTCKTFPPKLDDSPMRFTKKNERIAYDQGGRGYDFTTCMSVDCAVLRDEPDP